MCDNKHLSFSLIYYYCVWLPPLHAKWLRPLTTRIICVRGRRYLPLVSPCSLLYSPIDLCKSERVRGRSHEWVGSMFWYGIPNVCRVCSKIVPCFYIFTLLPFQGVDIIFLFHIPRVPLRLPWARHSFGLSARLGCRLPWVGKGSHFWGEQQTGGCTTTRIRGWFVYF